MLNKIRWEITYWVLNNLQQDAYADSADMPIMAILSVISHMVLS